VDKTLDEEKAYTGKAAVEATPMEREAKNITNDGTMVFEAVVLCRKLDVE
jgi:hypothetical protein